MSLLHCIAHKSKRNAAWHISLIILYESKYMFIVLVDQAKSISTCENIVCHFVSECNYKKTTLTNTYTQYKSEILPKSTYSCTTYILLYLHCSNHWNLIYKHTDMSYSGSVGRQTIGSLGSSEDSTTGSLKKPTFSERHPKAIRSITVIGYLFCVSLAAILLSAYYVVFWKPATKDPQKMSIHGNNTHLPCRTGENYVLQGNLHYSRRRYSTLVVSPGAQRSAPAHAIPEPSMLVAPAPAKNFESLKHTNFSNSSFHQNNSLTFGLKPMHNNNASHDSGKSRATEEIVQVAVSEEHGSHEASSEYTEESEGKESTFVPNPTFPSIKSILLQKLLHDNKSTVWQKHLWWRWGKKWVWCGKNQLETKF